MSNLSQFLGGGGGGSGTGQISASVHTTSKTITILRSGKYRISAIGAGGAGATGAYSSSPRKATGGGGGGFVQKTVTLNNGDTLTLQIGAGGIATGSSVNGQAGGATSVTGPGIALIANGGSGGVGVLGTGAIAATLGGTASGGDFNFQGGSAGSAAAGNGPMTTGGGAVNILGLDPASIRSPNAVAASTHTGGASPGAVDPPDGSSGGGGMGGPAIANTQGGPNSMGVSVGAANTIPENAKFTAITNVATFLPFVILGGGSAHTGGPTAPVDIETSDGGASGSHVGTAGRSGRSGIFAGSGSVMHTGTSGSASAGRPGFGGGGGAAMSAHVSTGSTSNNSRGGDGLVVIEEL